MSVLKSILEKDRLVDTGRGWFTLGRYSFVLVDKDKASLNREALLFVINKPSLLLLFGSEGQVFYELF